MKVSERLSDVAALVLEQGQPALFKRLIRASIFVGKHDSDRELAEGLEEHEEEPIPEEEIDDEDVEGFAGFPAGALPYKERRRGPHPKDVGIAKPDWWNPR